MTGNYTAGASGETMLFGWDDVNTSAVIDGTDVTIGAPTFAGTLGPNGLKVSAGGLAVAIECVMARESGDPEGPAHRSAATPGALVREFSSSTA